MPCICDRGFGPTGPSGPTPDGPVYRGLAVLPDPDQRAPKQPTGRRDRPSTVRIEDLGDEVHLRVGQRVPWTVALKIMKLLKDPDPPEGGEGEP